MAGRGPAPKDTRSRARDQAKRDAETVVVEASSELRGPDLPESFHAFEGEEWVESEWPPATVIWWQTWRRSAQASTFTETDWSFLLDTAVLHAEFWLGDRKVAPELRLRVAKFGATLEDRARLKLAVGEPQGEKPPVRRKSATSRTRRERLLKAVGDDD
jgi:hypothetical protein